jgi:hypothetical protein
MLTKSRSVLRIVAEDLSQVDENVVAFSNFDDPTIESPVLRTTTISRRDWESMGEPDTITVTVEPGDTIGLDT